MYESYVWPGAYSIKTEAKMLAKWLKKQICSLFKKIENTEKDLGLQQDF